MTETRIQLAAKLYDAREVVRTLWGDNYATKIKQYQDFIRAEMAAKNCEELAATMNIVRDLQRDKPDSGMTQMVILAACVEILEPTA